MRSQPEDVRLAMASVPPFVEHVPEEDRFTRPHLTTMQVNVGYKCNLACKHCHLQCSPARTEMASREVLEACLQAFDLGGFTSIDITGGAPEMHPDLPWLLRECAARGIKPIVRSNLCILTEPGYEEFPQLYADVDATVFASMPYYRAGNVDKIRGNGTFNACIEAMRTLNDLGFGTGQHVITLVYNPAGAVLPPDQTSLEEEFRRQLRADFGVEFTNLVTFTNNPSGRFAARLAAKGNLSKYMKRLVDAFNPATTCAMMCRDQISVDWQGRVYDCDFNQALGIPVQGNETIFEFADHAPKVRAIRFANHCYSCTAGAGSS